MGWKWENSHKTTILPVDLCRDTEIFNLSYLNMPQKKQRINNPAPEQKHWQWVGTDRRQFCIPIDVIHYLPENGNIMRDVISYLSQAYLDQGGEPIIETTYRQIAGGIGLAFNGKRGKEIDDALLYAKALIVKNQTIRTIRKGTVVEDILLFNFLDWVRRTRIIDGVEIPYNKIKTQIKISDVYGCVLKNHEGPKAPIPVAALEVANKSPIKYIRPVKNLIYRLAARVPSKTIEYKTSSLVKITGFKTTRKDRLQKILNNTIEILYPVMISDYQFYLSEGKYQITLAGKSQ